MIDQTMMERFENPALDPAVERLTPSTITTTMHEHDHGLILPRFAESRAAEMEFDRDRGYRESAGGAVEISKHSENECEKAERAAGKLKRALGV